jgi:tetratricopeptide (TPR) repeat protein
MIEQIDDYFEQRLSPEEKTKFEAELKTDPQLADAVAFYLVSRETARQQAREKKLAERHHEWQELAQPRPRTIRVWYAVAAAVAALVIGLGWYLINPKQRDLRELASGYAMEHFTTLSVQMGSEGDSVQLAIQSFNKGQYATALRWCESVLQQDPQNASAKKVAGIVSLRLLDYDKAIDYFHRLGAQKELYANPGKFYEAIALIRRNQPEDATRARALLQEVVDRDLEGKDEAVKWLD